MIPRVRRAFGMAMHFERLTRAVLAAWLVASIVLAVTPPNTAEVFAQGGVDVNLDQWANLPGRGWQDWQNGSLNQTNSAYPEGGAVPFRLAIERLTPGTHSFFISYDFTAGGHKAYDFLASYNLTESPNFCDFGGGAVSSLCPALPTPSTYSFPSDAYVATGLIVSGAEAGVSRNLTIFGGTINSISGPIHAGDPNGNSTAEVAVTFTSSGSAVLLAWGGHLATSSYWDAASGGSPDGAGQISGADWHMRTQNLDGLGARNQDRSIHASAILASPTPTPAPSPTGVPATPTWI